jgi:hypothetical protein
MELKMFLCLLVSFAFFGCSTSSSSDSDSPKDDASGYAENGYLNLTVEQEYESVYSVLLSQNGNVYVTTDGTGPSASNYKYHFTYDYKKGVPSSGYEIPLSDAWEANIRVLGIADGYPTQTEDGMMIVYDPPKAPEGTTVTLSISLVITRRSVSASSSTSETGKILVIPKWGTAVCSGSWNSALGGEQWYYLMEAGTAGTLRFKKNATNTGTFSASYIDGTPLTDGDAITAGTRFYLYAKQGSKWSNDLNATRYSFDFWVEE